MILRRLAIFALLAFVFPASGQIPGLPTKGTASTPVVKEESTEVIQKRLTEWQKEAKNTLARLDDPNAEAQLPKDITSANLADRRRGLDQMSRTITRTLAILDQIPDAKAALKEAEGSRESWNGFSDSPPYSILKYDELVSQRDAAKEKDTMFKSSSSTYLRSLDGLEKEARSTEDETRRTAANAEKNPTDNVIKWHLEESREKTRALSVRAMFIRANLDLLKEQSAASASRLSLLERQVTEMRKSIDFSDEDLASIRKSADDRRAAIRKEIAELNTRVRDATTAKNRAKAAFNQLNTESAQTNPTPELGLAAAKLSAAETRLEVLQYISENLESFDSFEGAVPLAYENRRVLLQSKDSAKRVASYELLVNFTERLQAWETVTANEIAALNAALSAQDSNAAAMPPDDPRQAALADQRKALWEKQAYLQRISQSVTAARKNILRWVDSYSENRKSAGLLANLSDSGDSLWSWIKGVWSWEVMKTQKVSYLSGVPFSDTKVITLGMIIVGFVLFFIAYLVSSKFSKRVQKVIVGRGHLAEAQANTLRNWMMIVVGIALALITLHFLEIPLTVFAYFGGALAIGLGFGTQTLIKNFISGIIVLFERKVRVGDVVELDANTTGTIVAINTRSSTLRSADGKETLIPNSLFLENRITNLTLSNRRVRRVIRFAITRGNEPSQVMSVMKECADRHGLILKEPGPVVILDDLTSSGPIYAIYYWTEFNIKTDSNVVASDLRIMIDKRFSETDIRFQNSDITIRTSDPFPLEITEPSYGPAPKTKPLIP